MYEVNKYLQLVYCGGVTDGGQRDESHPWQSKCKNRAST